MKNLFSAHTAGKGTTACLAGLLVASVCVRIFVSASTAIAASSNVEKEIDEVVELPLIPEDRIASSSPLEPERIMTLVDALNQREEKVAEKEKQIKMQTETLEKARVEIERRLGDLERAEQELRATIALANGASEKDLSNLVAVYENMKPKDAAALFEQMDPQFASGFLGRMRPDAAAKVMAGLSPQVAYSISAILAGRNAEVPTNQ